MLFADLSTNLLKGEHVLNSPTRLFCVYHNVKPTKPRHIYRSENGNAHTRILHYQLIIASSHDLNNNIETEQQMSESHILMQLNYILHRKK